MENQMLKRLLIAAAILVGLSGHVQAAGTVPGFSLVPQFDLSGKIAPGCKLYVIQAGTVSTQQNAYQDSGLTLLQPNPMLCDAAGRLPQWFVADGNIKLRLTDKNSTQIFVQDGLLVVGASSGGGGGSPVDPTTIFSTGDLKPAYGTSVLSGWVRANGRTIGSSTSGATERANADVQALFQYLWGADANLAVSGGRGASGAADWAANKTIALPDWRGRSISGLDDMGNSPAGVLTSAVNGFGANGGNPIVLGNGGGVENSVLVTANLPPYTPTVQSYSLPIKQAFGGSPGQGVEPGAGNVGYGGGASGAGISALTVNNPVILLNPQGGSSTRFVTVSPTRLATIYLKL